MSQAIKTVLTDLKSQIVISNRVFEVMICDLKRLE